MRKRVNILCEGPTEEVFVKKILQPYFNTQSIDITARGLGGNINYDRLKHEIIQWLNAEQGACVTTFIDLYGLKGQFPGQCGTIIDPILKVQCMESAMLADVLAAPRLYNQKFIPYIQLHEFEALPFTDPAVMTEWLELDNQIPHGAFQAIRNSFPSPEHINNSKHTAPSKRIQNIVPAYDKITDGNFILEVIGLPAIRAACAHFDDWITRINDC